MALFLTFRNMAGRGHGSYTQRPLVLFRSALKGAMCVRSVNVDAIRCWVKRMVRGMAVAMEIVFLARERFSSLTLPGEVVQVL